MLLKSGNIYIIQFCFYFKHHCCVSKVYVYLTFVQFDLFLRSSGNMLEFKLNLC